MTCLDAAGAPIESQSNTPTTLVAYDAASVAAGGSNVLEAAVSAVR